MATRNTLKLFVTADGKVAVRTFGEVADASDRTAGKVERDAERQSASFGKIEGGASRLKGMVGGLAATIGAGGLALGIADVVKAGETWQVQQAQLTGALQSVHRYSTQTLEGIRSAAEALSTHGGFSVAQQIPGLTQFIRLTGSAAKAVRDNALATDLARGKGLGLAQAQNMIAMALTGNVGRLQKMLGIIQPVKDAQYALSQAHKVDIAALENQSKSYGKLGAAWLRGQEILHGVTPQMVEHAKLIDKQATAQVALQKIQDMYGNSTVKFSNTVAGSISNLKDKFDLMAETVGVKVLPILTRVMGFISGHVDLVLVLAGAFIAVSVASWAASDGVVAAKIAMTLFGGGIGAVMTLLTTLTGGFVEMGMSAAAAWASATLGLSLLITALVLAVTHWQTTKRVMMDVFQWVKGHALLLAVALAPFTGGLSLVVAAVYKLRNAFTQMWNAVRPIIDGIKHAFNSGPLGALLGAGKSIVGGISGALGSIGLHTGGLIPHMASGGPLGGYGGGDRVPVMAEQGEYIVRKEAVQQVGVGNMNALNSTGMIPQGGGAADEVYVTAPITVEAGGRVLTEVVVHTSARRNALAGSFALAAS